MVTVEKMGGVNGEGLAIFYGLSEDTDQHVIKCKTTYNISYKCYYWNDNLYNS